MWHHLRHPVTHDRHFLWARVQHVISLPSLLMEFLRHVKATAVPGKRSAARDERAHFCTPARAKALNPQVLFLTELDSLTMFFRP